MSKQIKDQDGGWWNWVQKGLGLHQKVKNVGNVVATVDSMIIYDNKILLIKRGKNPYKDCWAFPGGRIEKSDDDLIMGTYRELKEETNIEDVELKYYKTVGNRQRDPRGFCITNVYVGKLDKMIEGIKAGDDAVDYKWFDMNDLPSMAFDHEKILREYLQ